MKFFYSPTPAPAGSFYIDSINGGAIPADAQEISKAIYDEIVSNRPLGKVIAVDADGLPMLIDPVPVSTVPQSVSPLQARKALRQHGLLATVQGAVAAADADTQDAWEYATSFDRTSPFVLGMAHALGWTDAQLNDLFVLAATL
jgi:hypothetical protein